MNTVTLWILIAVSSGYQNMGTTTVIARFASEQKCNAVRSRMPDHAAFSTFCVVADGVVP